MTQVRNQRDKLLRLAKLRVLNPIGSGIRLSLSAPGFHVLANNQVDIGIVTVEAELINIVGDVVFTSFNSPLSNVTATSADVAYTGDMAIVTASVTNAAGTFTRSVVIPVLRDGAIGTSSYVWIKYADGPNGEGLSDSPVGKTYIGLAQNKLTPTESNDPADYSYVLVKGSDATSLRMWIKYSDSPDGSNPYDTPTDNTMYIGIAVNKDDPVESTNKADYVWSRFRGGDGVSIPGSRGAGFYRTAGNTWSDDTANAATPGGNEIGDMVTISNGIVSYTKEWNGSAWLVPGAFLSGSLFVEKSIGAAQINANGLSIYTPDGKVIIDAGKTFAQQAAINPNLVPRVSNWPAGNRYSAAVGVSTNDPALVNGEYVYLGQAASGYVGMESAAIGIPQNTTYTVSFDAYCQGVARDLACDLYCGTVDTAGLIVTLGSGWKRYTFTESIAHADAPIARLRLYAMNPNVASPIIVANVKVEIGTKVSPWSDDIITPGNSGARVMPNSINNVQFGGDLWGSLWNGQVGPGGQGWLLDRDGNVYLNNVTARGTITGSLIESSAFRINSGRLLSPWDRLCPFSISDTNMQMWSSGSGDCDVQLRDFVGPLEAVAGSYNVKRFSEMSKDVFLKAHVASISSGGNVVLEVMYDDDGWWRTIAVAGLRGGALTVAIRYTTEGGSWNRVHFRARTDGGVGTSLAFEMEMNNLNTALYLGGTNSGIAVNSPPPPPPPPPNENPDPYCVDYETSHLPTGRLVRHLVVDDLVQVWDDNAESPSIEYAPALQVRLGYEQSYWMRSESGAEIIQSKSTPMTLRDGRVATTDAMLGEEVLVNRFGTLTWEPVVDLVDMGVRRVVKLSLGDRMYFAGIHPDATIATHNMQYKP